MVTVLRKLTMNGDRSYTGAAGKISNQRRSNCFLKMETEGAKTRCAGSLFQYVVYIVITDFDCFV